MRAMQCACCSLAEFAAKESKTHEKKPKKGTGRFCIGDSGDLPIVMKGHIKPSTRHYWKQVFTSLLGFPCSLVARVALLEIEALTATVQKASDQVPSTGLHHS